MSLLTIVQHGLIVFRFLFLFNPIPFTGSILPLPISTDHGVGCRPTEEDPQGVDDLFTLGSGMDTTPIQVLKYEELTAIARSPLPSSYLYSPLFSPSTATRTTLQHPS